MEKLIFPPGADWVHVPALSIVGHCINSQDCSFVPAGNPDKSSVKVNGPCNGPAPFGALIDTDTDTVYPFTPSTVVATGAPIVFARVYCGTLPGNTAYAHCGFSFAPDFPPHRFIILTPA